MEGDGIENASYVVSVEDPGSNPIGTGTYSRQSFGDSTGKPIESTRTEAKVIFEDVEVAGCGLGSCQPGWLQKCRSIGVFSLFYGLTGTMTSAISVYISSQITTLEKHFNLSSSESGLLMSCNDFGYFVTCLLFSHFARRVHIPFFLGVATLAYGVSGILCTVPYFGTKDYLTIHESTDNHSTISEWHHVQRCLMSNNKNNNNNNNNDNTSTTNSSDPTLDCDPNANGIHGVSSAWRQLAMVVIGCGLVLQGMAKSPRSSFVGVFIDDNTPKTKTSFYLGVIIAMGIFGPVLAFVVGGLFSSIYVTLQDTSMSSRDPRWLGAWWLGFLLFGLGSILCSIPLFLFPRRILVKREIQVAEKTQRENRDSRGRLYSETRGFFQAMARLFTTPVFILTVLGGGINMMGTAGLVAFSPKYLQVHFNQPQWKVNIVFGAVSVGAASLGSLLGGIITSKFKLSPYTCIKLMTGSALLTTLGQGLCLFIRCPQPTIITDQMTSWGTQSPCASSCHCSNDDYFPVCGEDGNNYFSPCHAGCSHISTDGNIFSNCSCLAHPQLTTVSGGLCPGGCDSSFWLYVSAAFIISICGAFSILPSFIVTIRSIPEALKPLALGVNSFILTLIGWFPGPIVFGRIIDSSCLISQSSPCTQGKGACLLHERETFRHRLNGSVTALKAASLFLYVITLVYAARSSQPVFQAHNDQESGHGQKAKTADIALQAQTVQKKDNGRKSPK